jgi:Ala-tRNA(Pro) deacylase
MKLTPAALLDRLAQAGIPVTTHHHAPVFTVAESQALRGQLPGGHCKSLFLRDKTGRYWLAVMLEHRRISVNALARALDAPRMSFATPEELMALLGVIPGAVTPFGLANDTNHQVTPVLDAEMLRHDKLHYHPLDNTMTTAISPQGLLDFIAGSGHAPRILPFDPLDAGPPPDPAATT